MSSISGYAKQGTLYSPSEDHSIGHEFVANRLPDGFYEVEELIFLAWIDCVSVPEGEGLHLLLRLLRDRRDARQQHRKKAQKETLLHCFSLHEFLLPAPGQMRTTVAGARTLRAGTQYPRC
jgi:hypothetical protein